MEVLKTILGIFGSFLLVYFVLRYLEAPMWASVGFAYLASNQSAIWMKLRDL